MKNIHSIRNWNETDKSFKVGGSQLSLVLVLGGQDDFEKSQNTAMNNANWSR